MERREGIFGGVNVALLRSEPRGLGRSFGGFKGLRNSGVKEEGWKVQGGRWKRGLKGGGCGVI
ncbi:hypothetical protein MCEMIH22_01118 [Candidatus Methylacidiphilaceae bacterium]